MECATMDKYKGNTPLKDPVHSPKTPLSENIFHNSSIFDAGSKNSTINKFSSNIHSSPPSVVSTPLKFTLQINANGKASLAFCENAAMITSSNTDFGTEEKNPNKETVPQNDANSSKRNSKLSTPLKHEKNKILNLLKQMKNSHSSSSSITKKTTNHKTNNNSSNQSLIKKFELYQSPVISSPLHNMIMLPSSPPVISNITNNNHHSHKNTINSNNHAINSDINHVVNVNNDGGNDISIPPSTPRANIHYSSNINPNYSNLISNMGLTPLLPLDQVLLEATPRLNRVLPLPHQLQFPFKNIGSDPLLMNDDDHWNIIMNSTTHNSALSTTSNTLGNGNATNITGSPLKDNLLKTPFAEMNCTSPMKKRKLSLSMTPLIQQTMAGSLSAKCVQQYSLSPNFKKISNSFGGLNNDNEIVRDDASIALKKLINR